MKRLLVSALMCTASGAWASVGKASVVDGESTRTSAQGQTQVLVSGTPLEVGDKLSVGKGHLKVELNDGSVIALDTNSVLTLTEAEFAGQDRTGFSAWLSVGKAWAKVKKSLSGAKFEISTERAVAGVRGTIFRIDADALFKAAGGKSRRASIVRVMDGVVGVKPSATVAKASGRAPSKAVPKGPRREVAAPHVEVTSDVWEAKFAELQAGSLIAVGVDLWEQAEAKAGVEADAFSKWLDKNP